MTLRSFKAGLAAVSLALVGIGSHAQTVCDSRQILKPGPCAGDELGTKEADLARLINEYRAENNLPAIPLSPSLSLVANRHVRDLAMNIKKLTHEWSDCPDIVECMWDAAKRLGTAYPGKVFENAYWTARATVVTAEALESWKEKGFPLAEQEHNNVILEKLAWKGKNWQALGIGIYNGYAAMWVGQAVDPASSNGQGAVAAGREASVPRAQLRPSANLVPGGSASFQPGDRYYKLQTRFLEGQNHCLDGNKPERGAFLGGAAFQDTCADVSGQLWKFVPADNGYFKLQTQYLEDQDMCLEGGSGAAKRSPAIQTTCDDVTGQLWKVIPIRDGYFKLQTMHLERQNMCLEGGSGAGKSSAATQQECQNVSGQSWKFSPR